MDGLLLLLSYSGAAACLACCVSSSLPRMDGYSIIFVPIDYPCAFLHGFTSYLQRFGPTLNWHIIFRCLFVSEVGRIRGYFDFSAVYSAKHQGILGKVYR